MFDALSDRLNDVFDRLRRHGALSEDDVASAMREIRVALLEADVALPVVRDFVNSVREKAIGQEVLRSVTPGQMVVKIVHDHLVEVLGGGEAAPEGDGIDLNATPPVGDHAGRAAGFGQDDDLRQDRAPAEEPRAQEGADGVARRAAPGGAGAARAARPPDRRRDPAGRSRGSARSRSPGARWRSGAARATTS